MAYAQGIKPFDHPGPCAASLQEVCAYKIEQIHRAVAFSDDADDAEAEEIRAVRERFGLTQSELARLLRLGANTVSRWESGRNVQTAAMDILVRLIRDLPASLDYLRRHAA